MFEVSSPASTSTYQQSSLLISETKINNIYFLAETEMNKLLSVLCAVSNDLPIIN